MPTSRRRSTCGWSAACATSTAGVLDRRIDRYLELFGLESDRYAPLSSFSKGMRQKVLIAAALLHDPAIVVLDEPCSGLDVASTLMLRSLVRALADAGKVIVYSSHVLDMVEKVCTDVIILHQGTVVAQDSVSRLRELAAAASLEEVFAQLAVDANVEARGPSPGRRGHAVLSLRGAVGAAVRAAGAPVAAAGCRTRRWPRATSTPISSCCGARRCWRRRCSSTPSPGPAAIRGCATARSRCCTTRCWPIACSSSPGRCW